MDGVCKTFFFVLFFSKTVKETKNWMDTKMSKLEFPTIEGCQQIFADTAL